MSDPTDAEIDAVARGIATANGDDLDAIPADKAEWTKASGMFGGRFRDVNAPMKLDYLDMARAAILAHSKALAEQGMVILPREPTMKMLVASWRKTETVSAEDRMVAEVSTARGAHMAKMKCRYRAMIDAAEAKG